MKPPAFMFYADDFLAGTLDLSQEEVGAYIRLLCHQWNRGSIPVEPEKQQRLAGGSVSADVLSKFEVGSDGLLRNARMEAERAKQDEYREKQRQKGLRSGQLRRNQIVTSETAAPTTVEPRLNHGSTPAQFRLEPEANLPFPSPSPNNTPIVPKGTGGVFADAEEESFKAFWSVYPNKASRIAARKAWKKVPAREHAAIMRAVDRSLTSREWTKDNGQFVPHASTYLNQERWKDEAPTVPAKPRKSIAEQMLER